MTTAVQLAQSVAPGTSLGFKNRIINGAMTIDQRNAGASVSASNGGYTLDRWQTYLNGGGAYTVQQSETAPTGFSNSLLVTVTTADSSIAAGDYYILTHKIEGFNFADCSFGTSSASAVTISFWVRSSLTGVFSGSIENSAGNRSYPFQYTISAANTFEYKTITIAGDTTGTWVGATNGVGLVLRLSLGMGSTYSGTANAWASADYYATSTETAKVIGTLGATFYITGVQLEVGTAATSFEFIDYGRQLAMCQRYYFNKFRSFGGVNYSNNQCVFYFRWPVPMRAAPTFGFISGSSVYLDIYGGGGGQKTLNFTDTYTEYGMRASFNAGSAGSMGNPVHVNENNLYVSAEL